MTPTLEDLFGEDGAGTGILRDIMASSGWLSLVAVRSLCYVCSSAAAVPRLDGMLRRCTSSLEKLHIDPWSIILPGEYTGTTGGVYPA